VSHRITLTPAAFTMVKFDAGELLALAQEAASAVGLPEDVDVAIEVDEALPLPLVASAADVADGKLVLWFSGGCFEDPRYQAQLEPQTSKTELGAALLRGRDRLDGGFADAPPDAELTDRQRAIWDVYAEGRLAHLGGFTVREPRRRYTFRLRGGFNDVADVEYEKLWAAPSLTWSELLATDERLIAADTRPQAKRAPIRKDSLRATG
jgi:hypothetical protein